MAAEARISVTDTEAIGKLINGFGILGSQLQLRQRPDFRQKAAENLLFYRDQYGDLLSRLDRVARRNKDESPLRLIEDLDIPVTDAFGYLTLARRCLLVCAFLGHCLSTIVIVQPTEKAISEQRILHGFALLFGTAPALNLVLGICGA